MHTTIELSPPRRARRPARAAVRLVAALVVLPGAAAAQPEWVRRVSSYELSGWSDLTFAHATARYEITLDADRTRSTVGMFTAVEFQTLSGARDRFWQGDGAYVSVDNVIVANPTLTTADIAMASVDPTLDPGTYPGYARLGYLTDVVDMGPGAFGQSWIAREIVGSRWALTFLGGGNGFVDGRRFDVLVRVAGDWTDPARFDVLGVNVGWTVLAPSFVGGMTTFHAFTTSYAGDTDAPGGNPNLMLRFYGAPVVSAVPEPATLALTTVGLGVLLLRWRRRPAA